ncbi:glycosyltransferase 87 family protein [Streptomyces sp. NBC_01275]|uniref:glycosyltransferase family 87 protein n=1 Tax=Streptomyces sp. NBC_01275 TaxID=2903807 RepID=UPI00224D487F|nr:glycosyltransferase family 87 protein [Streptomyces sp. NBC_01275]MCX4762554.1 glycosyltransferase 87 family protein [Streptomyces sp. NBC_01275]
MKRRRLLVLAAAWLATRALMLWLLAHNSLSLLGRGGVAREVWHLYHHWHGVLAHGAFPAHDPLWQYPPGAGPVLLSPALLPGLTYFQGFVALTLAADLVTALALARAGSRPGRSLRGPALWIGGLPLLLHTPLARYDVQVTALAVLSLLALGRSTRACGAFAAMGALVKAWPVLVLLGVPRGRPTRSAWTWAAATGSALLALLCLCFDNPFAFLRQQGGRGVQIESLGGTALLLATHAGRPGRVRYQYGAMEFTGPYVSLVADSCLALTAVAFGLLLLWRVRCRRWTPATPHDAALSAVLLFTVTSRVISPQYMVWLIGLAAVCLTSRHTTQRPVAALVVAATAVSAVVYPALYHEVVACSWTGVALMLLRNGLLAAAACLSFARLWHAGTARVATGTGGHPQAQRESPAPASL